MSSVDVVSLGIEVKSAGVTAASQALGGMSKAAGTAEERILKLITATEKLQASSVNLATASQTYITKLQQQALLMQNLATGSAAANASTQGLASAMALLAAALNTLNQSTQNATRSQSQHNDGMREAHGLARGLTGGLNMLWLSYSAFLGTAVGLGIATGLKAIVSIGKDVENTLEGIRVRGEESVGSIDKMRESIANLGKGVYGPKEVANAFDVLILAGLRADQALIGIKDALNLATVGGTSIEKAATVLVQVSTALGYTAEGFGRISDVIAKTAAVSISSVDGISESFKSASVVGKLYGQSLVDLGTQFAILSNLGIKNSAAGTSAKNFFSDLASGSDKVTRGLGILKLSIEDLQDKQGNFKSFNEVLRTLAGDSEKGFNSLTAANQKYVQTLITNERGNKLMTEGLSLVRQAGEETATKLDDISKRINESWGFTAQGAAAMALTVDAQFKSVKNTLQTQLGAAFVEIQPQLSLVATRLKAAFGSPEFLTGVQALATGVANMTVFVVENAGAIWEVVRALLAFKAAATIIGVLTGIAEGFVAMKAAMDLAKISALGLQAALGLVGLALAAGAALLVWWATKRDEAFGTKQTAALNYMDDFKGKLDEENTRLEKQIELMNKGKTATEAFTEAQQRLQLQKVKEQGANAIGDAQGSLDKTWKDFNNNQRQGVLNWKSGDNDLNKYDGQQLTALKEYAKVENQLIKVKGEVAKKEDETQKSLERNVALSKQAADLAEKQAKARGVTPEGTGKLPPEKDKAATNDALNKELQTYQNQINAAKRELEKTKEDIQSRYKQGLIGEREMIDANYAAEITKANEAKQAIVAKVMAVQGAENRLAAAEKFKGDYQAQNQAIEAADATKKNKYAEMEVNNQKIIQKAEMETALAKHDYSAAYEAEFKKKHEIQVKGLKADLATEVDMVKKAETEKVLAILQGQYDAGKAAADEKTSLASFMDLAEATRNALKGIQTGSEGTGLAGMFEAASAASATLASNMGELRERMGKLYVTKDINEAQAALTNLGESQRKMWAGVGESISKSLGDAFGNAGKAAGELLMVAINTGNVETKLAADKKQALADVSKMQDGYTDTAALAAQVQVDFAAKEKGARVKAYGDMAGAAKGFFKEGTTGYKVMEAAEKTFRAIELALAIKNFVMKSTFLTSLFGLKVATDTGAAASDTAYTGVSVTNSMMRGAADGVAAIAKAIASLPFPLNLIAGAATAAALIGFGVKVFGGGGGGGAGMSVEDKQKQQSTGSVLGASDAKSESIANSLTVLEKNSGLGLAHSTTMIHYLKNVSDNIAGLATALLIRSGVDVTKGPADYVNGGVIGKISNSIFGGNTTTLDTGIATSKDSLQNTLNGSMNAVSYAQTKTDGGWFSSDKYNTSMKSLGAETNSQFTKIIGNMADAIKAAADDLGVGGDAFTAHLNTFIVDIGAISAKGLTGAEVQKALEAAFSKLGDDMAKFAIVGLDKFQKVGEGYLETVMRVANDMVQVQDVFSVLGKTFNLTGVAAINVSESLIAASGGLDKLTTGAKFFVDNFLNESEKMEPITASVTKRMSELGYASVNNIDSFKALVRSLDLTDPASQKLYGSLMDIAPQFLEAANYATKLAEGTVTLTKAQQKALDIATKQREMDIALLNAQGRAEEALAATRADELASLSKLAPALAATQQLIYSAVDASAALVKAKTNLDASYQRESTALQGVIDKFKAFSESLKKFKDGLLTGAMSMLSPEQKYLESKSKFASTSASAATGDATALSSLQSVSQEFLDASRGYNASTEAYAKDFSDVQKGLTAGAAAADKQVNIAQTQLDLMKSQYNSLLDINESVLSFKDAVTAFITARSAAATAGVAVTQGDGKGSPQAQLAAYAAKNGDDAYYFNANNGYDAKSQVVDQLGTALKGMNYSVSDLWLKATGHSAAYWMEAQQQFDAGLAPSEKSMTVDGSHAGGLNSVPKDDYIARLHKGERVQTAAKANASDENSAELVALTKELLARISNLEEHAGASNSQRAAIAEMNVEQAAELTKTMEAVKRKLDVLGSK